VGIAFGAADRDDLVMKPLLVAVLWVLAGSYFGGLVERVTGLGMTLPVLAAFAICGCYLALRIARTPRSTAVISILPAGEQDERLAA
jgi:hypothetical protein